jgi:glycosyltransferase involved in cell wall biosynthesis
LQPTVTLSANTSWYLYNFRASTLRALLNEGYRVVCLSPADGYEKQLLEIGCEWRSLPFDREGANPLRELALLYAFWREYRQLKPVVAFHFTIKNNVYGTWAARFWGIPAVNNISGLGTAFIRRGVVPAMGRLLYRLSQPLAEHVFCQNQEDAELLLAKGLVRKERFTVLPGSGVDLQRFHPGLRAPRETGTPVRLLYAGRMLADKGLFELLAAMEKVNSDTKRCHLTLCGFAGTGNVSAIPEGTLEQWAKREDVSVLPPSNDMPGVFANADVVVLPSYREGMPRTLLEAGAMGLPVVTTDVPGCRAAVIDGVTGLLCQVKSSDSLAEALSHMLQMSDQEREKMGGDGRSRVETEFDERIVVNHAMQQARRALDTTPHRIR